MPKVWRRQLVARSHWPLAAGPSCWLSGRLALPPTSDGSASLGEVAMVPEDVGLRGAVVEQFGRVVAGAWVSAGDGAGLDLAVPTDAHGRFDLRRLGASGARSSVMVQHPGHAPHVGRSADLIVLEAGRRLRGTVALRSGMAAQDVVVHAESEVAWSAAAPRLRRAVGPAGLFEVRHVGREPQRLWASDRESGRMLGPVTRVAGAADDVADCTIETFADAGTSSIMRFELADVARRPVAGTARIVLVSDVGVRTAMERGVVQWPVPPEYATPMLGFQVPGYRGAPGAAAGWREDPADGRAPGPSAARLGQLQECSARACPRGRPRSMRGGRWRTGCGGCSGIAAVRRCAVARPRCGSVPRRAPPASALALGCRGGRIGARRDRGRCGSG